MLSTGLLLAASMIVGQAEDKATVEFPKAVKADFQSLIGKWKGSGTAEGDDFTVEYVFSWAGNGVSLAYTNEGEIDGRAWKSAGIAGWDDVKRQVVIAEFDNDGSHALLHLKRSASLAGWEGTVDAADASSREARMGKWTLGGLRSDRLTIRSWDTVSPEDSDAPPRTMILKRVE